MRITIDTLRPQTAHVRGQLQHQPGQRRMGGVGDPLWSARDSHDSHVAARFHALATGVLAPGAASEQHLRATTERAASSIMTHGAPKRQQLIAHGAIASAGACCTRLVGG